jgi:CheY-like chemotaxis protein
MVQALDHRLCFASRPGRGTVFSLDLPCAPTQAVVPDAAPEAREAPRGYGLYGTRVLLVENDETVLEAMSALLERWRCDVRSAGSTGAALSQLGDTAWIPDVVIADQHLDHGDLGSESILAVRGFLQRLVPALVVTADPSEALQAMTRACGIELMLKPAKPAQLRALLAHLLA